MTAAQVVGELLSVALAVAKEASAADQADILRRLDVTRAQLAALPSLALSVGEEAEKRRRELRERETESDALEARREEDTRPLKPVLPVKEK